MTEQTQHPKGEWELRDKEAREFWPKYVYASRAVIGQEIDGQDEMRTAINDCFRGIDKAIAKAIETGCIYMRHRGPHKHPEMTILIFSDGKGQRFQHSVKMDGRFAQNGRDLHFNDYWWFRGAVTGMILSEGKIKPDPRGGYIPDVIIDNVDKIRVDLEENRRSGEVRLKLSIDPDQT